MLVALGIHHLDAARAGIVNVVRVVGRHIAAVPVAPDFKLRHGVRRLVHGLLPDRPGRRLRGRRFPGLGLLRFLVFAQWKEKPGRDTGNHEQQAPCRQPCDDGIALALLRLLFSFFLWCNHRSSSSI